MPIMKPHMLMHTTIALGSLFCHSFAYAALPECEEGQTLLQRRQEIVNTINQLQSSKVTPEQSCALFRSLKTNGDLILKWSTINKDWCSVPQQLVDRLTDDHQKVVQVEQKICAASLSRLPFLDQDTTEHSGPIGGPGISGSVTIPKGALD